MEKIILQQLKNELIKAANQVRHPFKFFSLASVDQDKPWVRLVVLRKADEDLKLCFYTDSRSAKVAQIKKNNAVSALFYDPEQQLQLQIRGKAKVVANPEMLQKVWRSIPQQNQKDYTTRAAPGTPKAAETEVAYLGEQHHFCMVNIIPQQIDYLKLGSPHHLRLRFSNETGTWQGNYLVP